MALFPKVEDTFQPGRAGVNAIAEFARIKGMNIDVFLAPHAEQFGLHDKLAKMKPGAPNPFIDPSELHRFAGKMEADFNTELTRQKAEQHSQDLRKSRQTQDH